MRLKPSDPTIEKVVEDWQKMVETQQYRREIILEDIKNLILASAFDSIAANILAPPDIGEYLLAQEIEYLSTLCKHRKGRPQRLN